MTASSLSIIPRCLLGNPLRRLAVVCGLPVSGRKEELMERLTTAAADAPPTSTSRTKPVVLSIDVGIRNLAFSLFSPVSSSAASSRKVDAKQDLATSPPTIKLHAWRRLSLLAQDGDEGAHVDTATKAFTPAALAKTANAFLQETVLQSKPLPTHILIERQRWRSGGGSSVLEWTVRVNTLEAMLHASLRTLRDIGAWEGEVVSIQPERVKQLFFDADPMKTRTDSKKLKIELLKSWLGQKGVIVRPGNVEVGHMLDAYRDASKGAKRGRSKRVTEEEGVEGGSLTLDKKLDDLTDSLLQGIAWLRWQENRTLLRLTMDLEPSGISPSQDGSSY
ncbi:mitochondrial resolvase Ydc2 [Xylaria telfairii]|nr:mitochondrial resolvase Ydc2 [Xylaria telfairii]